MPSPSFPNFIALVIASAGALLAGAAVTDPLWRHVAFGISVFFFCWAFLVAIIPSQRVSSIWQWLVKKVFRRESIESDFNGSSLGQNPLPDMSIRDLFFHVDPRLQRCDCTECVTVIEAVKDALSDGRLHSWGRNTNKYSEGVRASWEEIAKKYWPTGVLIPSSFLEREQYRWLVHSKPIHPYTGPQYRDIYVNKADATRISPAKANRKWPKFVSWDTREKFELYKAACVFFDDEPTLPMPYRSSKLYDEWRSEWLAKAPGRLAILITLDEAISSTYETLTGSEDTTFHPHMAVNRKALIEWCEKHGEHPRFLFKSRRG